MSESIKNAPVGFERKGLPKSVESLMDEYSPQDIQLLCTGIYTEVLNIYTKENDLRKKKEDDEGANTDYDQNALSFSKKYAGRIIQSLGFSSEQVAQMFENPDSTQIEAWIDDVVKKERERIAANLSKEGVLEKIELAEQRLEEFFASAGVHKQTAPVRHGGPVLQMIMQMKQIESENLNPMYSRNQGEFYPNHGKAHVYHYDHEALTPDYYISMHAHENVHTYGVGSADASANTEVSDEAGATLSNFTGFSHVETLGESKVRRGAAIDEGATQYMNMKVLSGLVGDGEDTVFYPEEVGLYSELVSLVSSKTETPASDVEIQLAREYAAGGGLYRLESYLSPIIPNEMENFLK